MQRSSAWVSGGCLCGSIRYEVSPGGVFDSGYCHCSMCRRATGAPVVAWATVHNESFRLVRGTLRYYQSSPACRRSFCPDCGSQLFYDGPGMMGMTGLHVATLDEPAPPSLRPALHMCISDRLGWFEVPDELPQYLDNKLPRPEKR